MTHEQYLYVAVILLVCQCLGALYKGNLSFKALFVFSVVSAIWPGAVVALFIYGGQSFEDD